MTRSIHVLDLFDPHLDDDTLSPALSSRKAIFRLTLSP